MCADDSECKKKAALAAFLISVIIDQMSRLATAKALS